jgi:hypothetical protein
MTRQQPQPIVIAHFAMARIFSALFLLGLFVAFFLWATLHPESWTYYERKGPAMVMMQQGFGFFVSGALLLAVVIQFGPWLARGRGRTMRLEGGTLVYPGHVVPLDDIIDVRLERRDYGSLWRRNVIVLETRGGEDAIEGWWLKEDSDVAIARVKDALARHKAP